MAKKKVEGKRKRGTAQPMEVETYVSWKDEQGNEQSYRIDNTPESEWPAHVAAGMERLREVYAEHTVNAFFKCLGRVGVGVSDYRSLPEEKQTALYSLWEEYIWKPSKPTQEQLNEFGRKLAALFNVSAAGEPTTTES